MIVIMMIMSMPVCDEGTAGLTADPPVSAGVEVTSASAAGAVPVPQRRPRSEVWMITLL